MERGRPCADQVGDRESTLPDCYRFDLPVSSTLVTTYFRVNRSLNRKEYLATFSFIAPDVEVCSVETTPKGLQWSTALELPFSYIPDLELDRDSRNGAIQLPEFVTPTGTRKIEVEVHPWDVKATKRESPFLEAVLETQLLNYPTLVFPEEK